MKTTTITLMLLILSGAVPLPVEAEGEAEGDGVRTIYLVRHGYYDHNDDADPDVGKALVPLGVAQSRLVGARIRALPVEIDALYSSTMTRARQTARVINEELPHLDLQKTRILRECTPTTWREDIMEGLDPGEATECETQLEQAFKEFFVPSPNVDRHEILVCHGNVIRYLVTRAQGVDPHSWLMMSVGNCSNTVIRIKADGSFKILGVGDVGHVPPNLQTGVYNDAGPLSVPSD